jgi:GNAT superfamily N-acetyltransferase
MPDDVEALEIESTPTPDDVQFLDDRLYEFNVAATGIDNGRLLGIFVRDASGTITAGLSGWTWGDCCRIEKLWVREDLRRSGLGRRLVVAAEREAAHRGCRLVTLDSHSFQAPEFYRKLGYELWAVLDGYPSPHRHCYLRKTIA